MKRKLRILIGFLLAVFLFTSCLSMDSRVNHSAKKRYKNYQPADCGCH